MPKRVNDDQKRVAFACTIKPETKALILDGAQYGKSQGEVIDDAVAAFLGRPEASTPRSTRKTSKREKAIEERAASDVTAKAVGREDVDYSDTESTPTTHVATLDATSPRAADGRGKLSIESWRANRKPILKPKDRR